jgi:hypothetical protein
MTKSLFIVLGVALLLVGGGLYVGSAPVSEDDAIQRAARVTKGPDGKKTYSINDAEIRAAMRQRQVGNAAKENTKGIGVVLALSGAVLGVLGLLMPATGKSADQKETVGNGPSQTS